MSVSSTSISQNLKTTLNPVDMVEDTIRNFSSTYSHYVVQGDDESLDMDGGSDDTEDAAERERGEAASDSRAAPKSFSVGLVRGEK